MIDQPLAATVFDVLETEAGLAPLLHDLAAASRTGDIERMSDIAGAAQCLGDSLASTLAAVFARANEILAERFDAAYK